MTQTSLFPEDPTRANHGANPESDAAFERILPHITELQTKILRYASTRTGGLTVKSVIRDLELSHQTASARLTELRQGELLSPTGERRDGCAILNITAIGRRTLEAGL